MARERMRTLLAAFVCFVGALVLGNTYIGRLPDHRGFWLVTAKDELRVPAPPRPRRTVFIIVDGLRSESAETMKSARRLEAQGQCRLSDQGSYTVSRPVYALLSTGLEADRTGSRNNEQTMPLAAESIWELARRAGLRVRGASHLPWFQQLFPNGFDVFHHTPLHTENVFAPRAEEGAFDIDLYHPLYVDEAGHQHGGASPEYAAAVARADAEITTVLDTLDLTKDLVILTADHGHRDAGGHGGSQPEIRLVLECFAGPNIIRRKDRGVFDARVNAPLLAVLLGLPFPANMRAGDDELDLLWEIVRFDPPADAYVKDRKAAITSFRRQNEVVLEQWLGGGPGTWPRLYDRERSKQVMRLAVIALAAALLMVLRVRRLAARDRLRHVAFLAGALVILWAVHHAVLGDFDYTVVNLKPRFLRAGFFIVGLSALAAIGLHYALHRRWSSIAASFLTLLLFLFVINLGHIFVYGWPLGFPLPPDPARYWPFFGAIAQSGLSVVLAALAFLARPGRDSPE